MSETPSNQPNPGAVEHAVIAQEAAAAHKQNWATMETAEFQTIQLPRIQPPVHGRDDLRLRSAARNEENMDALNDILDRGEPVVLPELDNLDGLGDVEAAVAADGESAHVTRHRRPRPSVRQVLGKLNPHDVGLNAYVKLSTGEFSSKALAKAGKYAGAIALVGAGVGLLAKGYMMAKGHHMGGGTVAAWHTTGGHAEQPGTHAGIEGVADTPTDHKTDTLHIQTEQQPDNTIYHRGATGHDVSGRASNVTDWSRETIHDEAIKAGLSEDQANALAHDRHNVDQTNRAFYDQNGAVAHDRRHFMNIGDTYNTTDQHHTADDIVNHYKADHGLNTQHETGGAGSTAQGEQQAAGHQHEAQPHAHANPDTQVSAVHPEVSTHPNHEANPVLTAAAATVAAGVIATAGVIGLRAAEQQRRRRDQEAEYQMHEDMEDAETARRNPEDIHNHRADEESINAHRRRSRRRKHAKPFRFSRDTADDRKL